MDQDFYKNSIKRITEGLDFSDSRRAYYLLIGFVGSKDNRKEYETLQQGQEVE